jgi:hypothetical protein
VDCAANVEKKGGSLEDAGKGEEVGGHLEFDTVTCI